MFMGQGSVRGSAHLASWVASGQPRRHASVGHACVEPECRARDMAPGSATAGLQRWRGSGSRRPSECWDVVPSDVARRRGSRQGHAAASWRTATPCDVSCRRVRVAQPLVPPLAGQLRDLGLAAGGNSALEWQPPSFGIPLASVLVPHQLAGSPLARRGGRRSHGRRSRHLRREDWRRRCCRSIMLQRSP